MTRLPKHFLAGGEIVLLEVKDLTACYGSVVAIDAVSFHVNEGEIVAMIGPNGAGKSTVLKAVVGLLNEYRGRIDSGTVQFKGSDITDLRTDQLVRKGIVLVPEGRRVFPTMTVHENLQMGFFCHKDNRDYRANLRAVCELFPRLAERKRQKAGTLSSGEQQMLALGRGLMSQPKLLLADEPSLGLSPNFVDLIFDNLTEINHMGTSILLVEQNARMALTTAQRAYVFSVGKIKAEGKTEDLLENSDVKKAFLGG
jgi:branched-chain amino acid transport system ATP-binding protein